MNPVAFAKRTGAHARIERELSCVTQLTETPILWDFTRALRSGDRAPWQNHTVINSVQNIRASPLALRARKSAPKDNIFDRGTTVQFISVGVAPLPSRQPLSKWRGCPVQVASFFFLGCLSAAQWWPQTTHSSDTKSKRFAMYALIIVIAVLSPAGSAVTPVGVTSQVVGKFKNLDQCKAAANRQTAGGAVSVDLNLSRGVYWYCASGATQN